MSQDLFGKERGKYILFEGGEGSGKSTQASKLYDHFQREGISSKLTREPGGVLTSEIIRDIIINKEIDRCPETEFLLFAAARAELFRRHIIPSLEKGEHVISARGYFSSEIYQGHVKRVPLEIIYQINKFAMDGFYPNITFILDVPVKIGLAAKLGDEINRFEMEDMEFHQRVREGYLNIPKQSDGKCVLIERDERSVEEIHELVKQYLRDMLEL